MAMTSVSLLHDQVGKLTKVNSESVTDRERERESETERRQDERERE